MTNGIFKVPNDINVEQLIIGAMLLNPDIIPKVKSKVFEDDFFSTTNREIFNAVCNVGNDVSLIIHDINSRNKLKNSNVLSSITDIIDLTGTSANVDHHIEILKDASFRRKIIISCNKTITNANDQSKTFTAILAELKESIKNTQQAEGFVYRENKVLVNKVFDDIKDRIHNHKHHTGVLSGFNNIDNHLNGFEPKTLTYIIGRPSIGKTALALNIADNMAIFEEGLVVFFSLEMGDEQITRRRLSSNSYIPLSAIRSGNIKDDQWKDLIRAADVVSKNNILVVDQSKYKNLENLVTIMEVIALEHKVSAVFVDHIQLMNSSKKFNNRHLEISHISNNLKSLAKDFEIPVIALSQLNRSVEERGSKRPVLSSMKECVVGGTEIALDKGLFRTIKRISDNSTLKEIPVKTYHVDKEFISFQKANDVFSVGKKRCLRIRLKSGKMIEASEGTKFWDGSNWVKADHLKIGDKIATDATQAGVNRKGIHFNDGRTWIKPNNISWNKGLTKETDERVERGAKKISVALKGKHIPKPSNYSEIMREKHRPLGVKKNNRGYVLIYMPDWPSSNGHDGVWKGYIFEHRYVMEKFLGRSLKREETIHHINGDKLDNRIENLYLCANAREHQNLHIAEQRFVENLIKEGKVVFDGKEFILR